MYSLTIRSAAEANSPKTDSNLKTGNSPRTQNRSVRGLHRSCQRCTGMRRGRLRLNKTNQAKEILAL